MDFKKNKYAIIRKAISKDLAIFVYNYFLIRKQVYDTCLKERYISPFEDILGYYEKENQQVPNTYSIYADAAGETLLLKLQPLMEKITKMKLTPNYSYARVYKKGDELKRHKDRDKCEISTTLNLGGDNWPIYLNLNSKAGYVFGPKMGKFQVQQYSPTKDKGIKINLKPGDMLVYRGCDLEHWREPFEGERCGQVFLHYNNSKNKNAKKNMFDGKIHLGLPSYFMKS